MTCNASYPVQEACALRFLQARNAASDGGLVKLSSAFMYCGHVCLVLERLHGSLLDYVVHSASLCKAQALQNLRKIAVQLLVQPNSCCLGSNTLPLPPGFCTAGNDAADICMQHAYLGVVMAGARAVVVCCSVHCSCTGRSVWQPGTCINLPCHQPPTTPKHPPPPVPVAPLLIPYMLVCSLVLLILELTTRLLVQVAFMVFTASQRQSQSNW